MRQLFQRLKAKAARIRTEVAAVALAYRDPRVPWHARAVAVAVIAYALSPLDLIPDVIPVLGYVDDLILLPLGIGLVLKLIPPEVLAECRERVRAGKTPAVPRWMQWSAGAAIVTVWLLLLGWAAVWLL